MVPTAVSGRAPGGALKKALAIVAILLLAFCVVPLPALESGLATVFGQSRGTGPLRAGAARVRIELGEHPVLAGYFGHRRAADASQPVYARAIVVEAGGARVTLAAIDTLLIPPRLAPDGCALLAATHTHSGPGGLWNNAVAGWMGAGAPDDEQQKSVQRALQAAVAQAAASLGPAELQMGRELWTEGPARPRSEGPIDPELVALRLRRPSGATIATLVVYAMHPTSAPRESLSADWPAQLESDAPVLALQGAVGNTTWPRDAPLAAPIAEEVEKLLRDAPLLSDAPIECETRAVATPPAQASRRVPWLLRRAVGNLLTLLFAPSATQTRLRLGPLSLLGVPGEPVGELGLRARPTVLVGLAGGYLGYVETPQHWELGEGESGKTYFGPDLARALGL